MLMPRRAMAWLSGTKFQQMMTNCVKTVGLGVIFGAMVPAGALAAETFLDFETDPAGLGVTFDGNSE